MDNLEILHWVSSVYTAAALIATILVQFIPTPQEIPWRPWTIFFNMLQRLSVHRRPWNNKANGPLPSIPPPAPPTG